MTTTLDSGALSESTGLRFAAACGVMGSTGFIVLWLAAGLWERRYNTARQDISDFGALTATHPDIYNTGVCVVGVLLVVLAIGVIAAGGRSRAWNAGSFALLSFGACQFLDGVFREDCSPSGDPPAGARSMLVHCHGTTARMTSNPWCGSHRWLRR